MKSREDILTVEFYDSSLFMKVKIRILCFPDLVDLNFIQSVSLSRRTHILLEVILLTSSLFVMSSLYPSEITGYLNNLLHDWSLIAILIASATTEKRVFG
eukprot:TRINITY_DN11928_c0_g1_i2.p1 TRINITY_DN11928_c0_g1~~TRINITY_DN11928_c0_g1_i2.p1  ORF type:complete len:100 (+),score=1.97 TRINITY_DN11928_c0_g1_i2:198-497(+)